MNLRVKEINERLSAIDERRTAIAAELEVENADLDTLGEEVRTLNDEYAALQAEKRSILLSEVAGGAGTVTRSFGQTPVQRTNYTAASPEYRSAFLKNLLGEDLNNEERAAFVHTTTNTPNVLPTTMLNRIWDLVSTEHSIMGDITVYRTGTILEVVKHTGIVQGTAKTVAENTANDDEQNTFVKVTLSGKDFSKHVDISYAMERMSIDALEQYLTTEIARQLGAAMAADVVSQIGTDMASSNKKSTAKARTLTFAEVASLFGSLARVTNVVVYAKRSTIYNYLVGMVDTSGRPIFQTTAQQGAAGTILGATIKAEDAVADNKLLIGDPSKVVYNMVQDIMIESDRDIKKHVTTYSGYARGQGALIDEMAFAELTVTTA